MTERETYEVKAKKKIKRSIFTIFLVFIVIIVIAVLIGSITIINDGSVGVKKTLGDYNDEELGTGLHLALPIISKIYEVDVKTRTIDEHVSVPSKEGLVIEMDVSVIYKIRADKASEIKQEVYGDVKDTLLVPYIRNGIRDIVSGYVAQAVYQQDTRVLISDSLETQLKDKLSDRLIIEDVILRDVTLPEKLKSAIEDKLNAEQRSIAKEFEVVQAQKDAEIEIEKAKGVAEANRIIAQSITKEYLQYRFIEGLNDGNTETIYVPTETNLPLLEIGRRDQ